MFHSFFYGWEGGGGGGGERRWFLGGHPKIFELKGGPSQKLRKKGVHAGICAGLRGHSEIIEKPPPPTHKR